eukprot:GHVU01092394.1.p1 GENE.GHVU01092394.1~~GHVU01092394.1.p1  ORF type:complete len:101 (+),score=0.89 GHVU01092394.1:129-431(+)
MSGVLFRSGSSGGKSVFFSFARPRHSLIVDRGEGSTYWAGAVEEGAVEEAGAVGGAASEAGSAFQLILHSMPLSPSPSASVHSNISFRSTCTWCSCTCVG